MSKPVQTNRLVIRSISSPAFRYGVTNTFHTVIDPGMVEIRVDLANHQKTVVHCARNLRARCAHRSDKKMHGKPPGGLITGYVCSAFGLEIDNGSCKLSAL